MITQWIHIPSNTPMVFSDVQALTGGSFYDASGNLLFAPEINGVSWGTRWFSFLDSSGQPTNASGNLIDTSSGSPPGWAMDANGRPVQVYSPASDVNAGISLPSATQTMAGSGLLLAGVAAAAYFLLFRKKR